MATIRDVAKKANVSIATVSYIMTGRKYVSPELTIRVNNAIEELNYIPSKIARSLKVKKTNYIGLIVPDILNPYFAEVVRGVESIALKEGYQIFLYNTDGEVSREEQAYNSFLEYHIAGVINVVPRMKDADIVKLFSIPTVLIDKPLEAESPLLGLVYTDNSKAAAEVAQHFIENGHKRFGCIAGPADSVYVIESRVFGYIQKLKESGFTDEDIMVAHGGEYDLESGYEMMQKLLSFPKRPTAVFVSSDIMALGAIDAIKKAGLGIPEDVAVIGYDNVYFAPYTCPALSTVNQKKYEAGQIAIQMLLDKIEKKTVKNDRRSNKIILDADLIVRESG